jgi:hypothetical protein
MLSYFKIQQIDYAYMWKKAVYGYIVLKCIVYGSWAWKCEIRLTFVEIYKLFSEFSNDILMKHDFRKQALNFIKISFENSETGQQLIVFNKC